MNCCFKDSLSPHCLSRARKKRRRNQNIAPRIISRLWFHNDNRQPHVVARVAHSLSAPELLDCANFLHFMFIVTCDFRRCFNHHVTRDTFNFSRRLLSELRILSRESRWCFPCQHFHFLRVEEKEFYDLVFAGKRNERQSRPLIWLCLNIENVLIMGACRLMTMKRLIGEFTGNRRTFPMKLAKLPGWASRRWLKTGNPPESVPLTSYLSFQSQMKLERMSIIFLIMNYR